MLRLCETCFDPRPRFAGKANLHCVKCELEITKVCRCCGEEKPLTRFYVSGTGDGREGVCSACVKKGLAGGYCWTCFAELDSETVKGKNARYCDCCLLERLAAQTKASAERQKQVIDHHSTPIAQALRMKW